MYRHKRPLRLWWKISVWQEHFGLPQTFGFYTIRKEAGCQIYSFIREKQEKTDGTMSTHTYTQHGGAQMALQEDNKTKAKKTKSRGPDT